MLKYLLTMLFVATSPLVLAQSPLVVEQVKIRALLPGVPNTAAFMTIYNHDHHAVQLIAASSSVANRVELHSHIHQDGMMKMRKVEAIPIPAQGQVELKSGSYHVMLFGVDSLKVGGLVPLTLTFSTGKQLQVQAQVVDMMTHHHH